MKNGDNRSVSTDALETLGTIIDDRAGRDAIHLAVEPMKAGERLQPGQHVGINNGVAVAALGGARDHVVKKLGIVDPFLTKPVEVGQKFWLVVYPRQISSLRHVWTHPDFADEKTPILPTYEDEEILRQGAEVKGTDYETFMDAINEYVSDCQGGTNRRAAAFSRR